MDKPKITPKDFFLWLGGMLALYVALFAYIALLFSYLNYLFPDALSFSNADPYANGVSYYMASLMVLTPLFVLLMRFIHTSIERDPTRADIWVRRWALYLTLFFATVTIAGDLITLLMYFFNGDVSLRFLLKVLIILLVAGGGFLHFLADLRGYWSANPTKARAVGWAVGVLVIVSIAIGFLIIGTPWQAREYRYDEQKISDLQNIQYQIVNYWQAKQTLPANLDALRDPIGGTYLPVDPQTGGAYEYRVTAPQSFELCAIFNAETRSESYARSMPIVPDGYPVKGQGDNWYHKAGRVCFDRPVDPDRYPPFTKSAL